MEAVISKLIMSGRKAFRLLLHADGRLTNGGDNDEWA